MYRILRIIFALNQCVIESFNIEGNALVISVRPYRRHQKRCPICNAKCDVYDLMHTRRWRTLDAGLIMCYLQYRPARVACLRHGVHVESVPWARHRSRFTTDFEDRIAWMAVHCTISAVAAECRIQWRTVGDICARAYADLQASRGIGRFDGLRRIGIDETSYKKGHKYLTVIIDHDRGCLIWACEGYGKEALERFFDELSREQKRAIEVVTADGAKWIKTLVKRRCPNARWVMDPFHVVSWMNEALNDIRAQELQVAIKNFRDAARCEYDNLTRKMKSVASPSEVKELKEKSDLIKGSRYALLKNPESHTKGQQAKLTALERSGSRLFKAWLLKEELRAVFKAADATEAAYLLDSWLKHSSHSMIPRLAEVREKIKRRKDDIISAVALGISNARVEAINNKIKVTIRMGYGFRNTDNLIALVMLRCSDIKPQLPGRKTSSAKPKASLISSCPQVA